MQRPHGITAEVLIQSHNNLQAAPAVHCTRHHQCLTYAHHRGARAGMTAMITMYNVKQLLEEGRFETSAEAQKRGVPKQPMIVINRSVGRWVWSGGAKHDATFGAPSLGHALSHSSTHMEVNQHGCSSCMHSQGSLTTSKMPSTESALRRA